MSTTLSDFYDAFLSAVLDDDGGALSSHLRDPASAANARVYRNTIYRGAVDVLANAYPAVRSVLGVDYFDGLAATYVDGRLAVRRTFVGYGEEFASFIGRLSGLHHLPYLEDIARLDRNWLEAHLAPDADALDPAELLHLGDDALAACCLQLRPSVRIVHSEWDVFDVWAANRAQDGSELVDRTIHNVSKAALIWRHDNEICVEALGVGDANFLSAIESGHNLTAAAGAGAQSDEDFDPSAAFAKLLERRIFVAPNEKEAVRNTL